MFLTEMIKFIFVHFLSAFPLTVFDCVDNIQVSDRTDRRLHKSSRQALCHFFGEHILWDDCPVFPILTLTGSQGCSALQYSM
jgi:hypothetical protein